MAIFGKRKCVKKVKESGRVGKVRAVGGDKVVDVRGMVPLN